MSEAPLISALYRAQSTAPWTISDLNRKRAVNVEDLCTLVGELHSVVQKPLQTKLRQGRKATSNGSILNFTVGNVVLITRDDFYVCEKLRLRWRGPHCVVKPIND